MIMRGAHEMAYMRYLMILRGALRLSFCRKARHFCSDFAGFEMISLPADDAQCIAPKCRSAASLILRRQPILSIDAYRRR